MHFRRRSRRSLPTTENGTPYGCRSRASQRREAAKLYRRRDVLRPYQPTRSRSAHAKLGGRHNDATIFNLQSPTYS
jgi:hypothetical protein